MGKSQTSYSKVSHQRKIILCIVAIALCGLFLFVIFGTTDPDEEKQEKLQERIQQMHEEGIRFISRTRQKLSLPENGTGEELTEEQKKELLEYYKKKAKEDRKAMREIREEIKKLKPESRKKIVKTLMKSRLDQARKQSAHLSDREKKEIVDKMVEQVRERRENRTPEKRAERIEKMETPEEKQRMKEAMDFYMNELSAKERELLDPLVREILTDLESLDNEND